MQGPPLSQGELVGWTDYSGTELAINFSIWNEDKRMEVASS